MFGTSGKSASLLRLMAYGFFVYLGLSAYVQIGATLEARRAAELLALDASIDPVNDLYLDTRSPVMDGCYVSGVLDKAKYPNGREAEFKGMLIYDDATPPARIPWRRTVEGDNSPASRKAGVQTMDFVIHNNCDVIFTVTTRHKSPLTGRSKEMEWGPFAP